jgi:fibronectin type 3 domain-containing protein
MSSGMAATPQTQQQSQQQQPHQQQQKPSSSRVRRDKDDTTNPDVKLTSVGNYVFQKTVGEGNFAKVKLAKHRLTGSEVLLLFLFFLAKCGGYMEGF